MSQRLVNMIKGHAGAMDSNAVQPRWATVESVDPDSHLVKVKIQPEDVLTDWIPVMSQATGPTWGLVWLPKPSQQVLVIFENGDGGPSRSPYRRAAPKAEKITGPPVG